MASKLHAVLTLGRISNLPTIWTNCLAAWVLNQLGREIPLFELPSADIANTLVYEPMLWLWILIGASLLYVAGTTLNDAFDEDFDRKHNSDRPIPAGVLATWQVWVIGIAEMLGGAGILYFNAGVSPLYLGLLCLAILSYDAVHKKWSGSVLLMGACRLFLWWTIATAGAGGVSDLSPLVLVWSTALLLYIAGITFVARGEATGHFPTLPWPFVCLFVHVILGFFFCLYGSRWVTLLFVLPMIYGIYKGITHARRKGPGIGQGVALWLALITLGDAIAISLLVPGWGLALAVCYPICMWMQKHFAAT